MRILFVVFSIVFQTVAWAQDAQVSGGPVASSHRPQHGSSGRSQRVVQDDAGGSRIVGPSTTLAGNIAIRYGTKGRIIADNDTIPTGLTATVANPAALAVASVVALRHINTVIVTSMSGAFPPTVGYGVCGVTFTIGMSTPTGIYGEILNAASGIYWEPHYSNSPAKACEFGTIGDGNINHSTGAITGTDNSLMIQAAFNYAMQNGLEAVCLNDGRYVISDTLQLGWGETFRTLSLVACNMGRAATYTLAGVQIIPTKTDRCALNIQGGRQVAVKAISFYGQNDAYNSNVINSGSAYPVTEAGWFNPALVPSGSNPGGLQKNSPYAAICIDAYAGSAPSDAYPTVPYPSWTGIMTQYGKLASSDIELTNINVIGFAVGINSKPNDSSNGDFVKIDKFSCFTTTYCASIGNTQSRNVQFTNVVATGVFAVLTNDRFGQQAGVLDGPISNISCGQCYELFHIGKLSYFGNVTLSNIYGESIVRIGSFNNGANFNATITFDGCRIILAANVTQVLPSSLIDLYASNFPTTLSFRACAIEQGSRIDTLIYGTGSATIDGGDFQGGFSLGSLFNLASVQHALNYTGGVFIGGPMTYPSANHGTLKWLSPTNASYMTTPNSVDTQQGMGPDAAFVGWRGQFTQATTGFFDTLNHRRWTFALGPIGQIVGLTAGQSYVSVAATFTGCDTMTYTYVGAYQGSVNPAYNLALGDMLYHENTGTIFVVTAVDSADGSGNYPVTTRQMNNMNVNPNTLACVSNNINDPLVSGNVTIVHTSVRNIPQYVSFGTFTSGSVSVTNVQHGGNDGSDLTKFIIPGDRIWSYPTQDAYLQWPYPPAVTIASVTNGLPGNLTLSSNATQSGIFPILPLPVIGGPQ